MNPPSPFRLVAAVIAGWLVPGAGHFFYGRATKGVYFGVLILIAFGIGMWLGDGRVIHAEKYSLYLLAQFWLGGPTLIALEATRHLRITFDIPYHDAGLLFTASAGLLNVVVLVDLWETHLKDRDAALAEGRRAT